MGVPVVDGQRLAVLLRQRDVGPEAVLLDLPALLAGAEVVQPGLPHRPHPRAGAGQPVDLGQGRVQLAGRGEDRHLVGMQGHPGHQRGVLLGGVHRPARAWQVTADLHDSRHADRGRTGHGLLDREPLAARAVGDVQVAVGVGDRDGQRWRRLGPAAVAAVLASCPLARGAGVVLGGHDASGSSILGNSGAPLVSTDASGSWPQLPASVRDWSASAPMLCPAPSISHRAAALRGITGL